MDSIDNIARMLEPDNEIERIRIKLRLRELAAEIHIYRMKHPNTKLSQDKILRRVKRGIAWRTLRNYLRMPLCSVRQDISSLWRYFIPK